MSKNTTILVFRPSLMSYSGESISPGKDTCTYMNIIVGHSARPSNIYFLIVVADKSTVLSCHVRLWINVVLADEIWLPDLG